MKKGTIVKMSESCKTQLINNNCKDHVDEFGECEGVVIGPMFPEVENCEDVDVRWKPSNLKYGYSPDQLEIISDHYFKGYIHEILDSSFYVSLERDYCLHKELHISFDNFTDEQIKFIELGRVFRYDEETGLLEMLKEDWSWEEIITIFQTEE